MAGFAYAREPVQREAHCCNAAIDIAHAADLWQDAARKYAPREAKASNVVYEQQ
jgi:hypothetical protein